MADTTYRPTQDALGEKPKTGPDTRSVEVEITIAKRPAKLTVGVDETISAATHNRLTAEHQASFEEVPATKAASSSAKADSK